MNVVRAKILLSWLLLLGCGVLFCFRYEMIGWCIVGVLLLIRYTKPYIPRHPPWRLGLLTGVVIIAGYVLRLLAGLHTLPPSLVPPLNFLGLFLAVIGLCGLLFCIILSDYRVFRPDQV